MIGPKMKHSSQYGCEISSCRSSGRARCRVALMTPRSHYASHASFHWRRAPASPPRQVNRFQTRLKPIASFLDEAATSGTSRWMRGGLPRQVLRRAKLTETAMRLAVLGLTKDAERFTVDSTK